MNHVYDRIENGDVDMTLNDKGIPAWMISNGDHIDAFEENTRENRKTKVFSISAGKIRNTRGILFWTRPFIITRGNKRICILLMDTQGLWDNQTKDEFNCSIFGLSSFLSSFMIFNQKNNINTDQLNKFSILSQFSRDVVAKEGGKPFQHLDILLRDYEDYKRDYDVEKGIQLSEERLEEIRTGDIEGKAVKEIEECFNMFDLFCFPNPGGDVMDAGYEGVISQIKPQFLRMLSYYINRLIRGDGGIEPREIGGVTITGDCFVK